MGCFAVFKSKKKKLEKTPTYIRRVNPQEHSPTALPEPHSKTCSLQSAPPSFKNRAKPIQPPINQSSSRSRALSAPSSLHDHDALLSIECDVHEELNKSRPGSRKEHRSPSPQPLPLPSPPRQGGVVLRSIERFKSATPPRQSGDVLRSMESFKSVTPPRQSGGVLWSTESFKSATPPRQSGGVLRSMDSIKSVTFSGPINVSGPLPLPPCATLRNFSYVDIVAACQNFSPDRCVSEGLSSVMYRASFGDDDIGLKKLEATVTRLHSSSQGLKDFVNEVNTLASMQHPNLCKVIGFHANEASEQRMLVYERLFHGSLDRFLYRRSEGPPINWNARTKVALCAAQGLTFLHEEGPFQAMFNEFSTANIQIDKDFNAKLSGYGCINHIPESEILNSSVALANLSVETLEKGLLTPKSNVWCFGVVLLELLTGRKNLDSLNPKEERNLVKWSKPFLADDSRLTLIMDPHLKGRFPTKAARIVADIAQRCLQIEPSERPTMRTVVEHLKTIQDMKHSYWYPLKEPETVAAKNMFRSPSLNGIKYPPPRSTLSPSLSMTRPPPPLLSLFPPRCSSIVSIEETDRQEIRKSPSSPGVHRSTFTVEEFFN